MTSAPGSRLAAKIACRSEPRPLSLRLSTVKVLSKVRSSRTRSHGLNEACVVLRRRAGRVDGRSQERIPTVSPPMRATRANGSGLYGSGREQPMQPGEEKKNGGVAVFPHGPDLIRPKKSSESPAGSPRDEQPEPVYP